MPNSGLQYSFVDGGYRSKQDLRYTQKPKCFPIFTENSRSCLLWSPVVLKKGEASPPREARALALRPGIYAPFGLWYGWQGSLHPRSEQHVLLALLLIVQQQVLPLSEDLYCRIRKPAATIGPPPKICSFLPGTRARTSNISAFLFIRKITSNSCEQLLILGVSYQEPGKDCSVRRGHGLKA